MIPVDFDVFGFAFQKEKVHRIRQVVISLFIQNDEKLFSLSIIWLVALVEANDVASEVIEISGVLDFIGFAF